MIPDQARAGRTAGVGITGPRAATILQVIALAVLVAGVVPLAAPLLLPGFMLGHDGGVHPWYAFIFDRALRQGQLPVRWVEGVQPGLGQPLFNYYQVGFYYLVAIVHALGPPLIAAFKFVVIAQWVLGAVFIYLLCRPMGSLSAAIGAAVYLWTPYLLLDAYVRNAYPEFAAIGFAPGLLWAVDRTLRTGRLVFVCALAMFTAWLLMSHLPTAVIIAPVALAYAVALALTDSSPWPGLVRTAAGALLGAGLAAFYTAPAILEIGDVRLRRMTAGYFDFHKHFVEPRWWVDWSWGYGGSGIKAPDQMSMQIGMAQWAVIVAAVCVLVVPAWRRRLRARPVLVGGALAAVGLSMLMMTSASLWVWEHVGPMAFIQFPWRLLMVPAILCAIIAAAVASTIRSKTAAAVLLLAAVGGQWYATDGYRAMATEHPRAMMLIDDPQWVSSDEARGLAFREASYDPVAVAPQRSPAPARWRAVDDTAMDVTAAHSADADLLLNVRVARASTLVLNIATFPGWQILVDGRTARPAIQEGTGYMALSLAAGPHVVHATFGRDRLRWAADLTTLVSLVIWMGLLARGLRGGHGRPAARWHPVR